MSQKKLNEIKKRIDEHFLNELNIMSDILEYLTAEESENLTRYMENHPHKPSQVPDMLKQIIDEEEEDKDEGSSEGSPPGPGSLAQLFEDNSP